MPFARCLVLMLVSVAVAPLAGCGPTKSPISKERFSEHVKAILAGRDSALAEAGKLTDFPWKSLCFERGKSLLLKFERDGDTATLSLPYEEFFVDEAHVKHSLEGTCVAPSDHILVRKKYPAYQGAIEFQKAP